VPPTTITAGAKRELAPRAISTGSIPIVTAITLYNIVFAEAGVVANDASATRSSVSNTAAAATPTPSNHADSTRSWADWRGWGFTSLSLVFAWL
jgi:hypothetical protein